MMPDRLQQALLRTALNKIDRVLSAERWPSGKPLTMVDVEWLARLTARLRIELNG